MANTSSGPATAQTLDDIPEPFRQFQRGAETTGDSETQTERPPEAAPRTAKPDDMLFMLLMLLLFGD